MGENIVRKGEIACYNFSSSHNVFHSYVSYMRQNASLYGNGLTKGKLMLYMEAPSLTNQKIWPM